MNQAEGVASISKTDITEHEIAKLACIGYVKNHIIPVSKSRWRNKIGERQNTDNSWLQFNLVYSNNTGTASPTQPQSVGGNYSPGNALKPRILTYINYSSTVSHNIFTSPFFYYSSENITYNISHNPRFVPILQIRLLSSRAQARLTLRPD